MTLKKEVKQILSILTVESHLNTNYLETNYLKHKLLKHNIIRTLAIMLLAAFQLRSLGTFCVLLDSSTMTAAVTLTTAGGGCANDFNSVKFVYNSTAVATLRHEEAIVSSTYDR